MKKVERKRVELRLDPMLANLLDEEAAEQNRTLSNHIDTLLQRHVSAMQEQARVTRMRARVTPVTESPAQVTES